MEHCQTSLSHAGVLSLPLAEGTLSMTRTWAMPPLKGRLRLASLAHVGKKFEALRCAMFRTECLDGVIYGCHVRANLCMDPCGIIRLRACGISLGGPVDATV